MDYWEQGEGSKSVITVIEIFHFENKYLSIIE
jgi:hypothetical protein